MKTFLPLIILALFFLGSCTETIYEEVFKTDTLWLEKPRPTLAPTFITVYDTIETVRTDTIRIETVITKTDTLIQYVVNDSLIIQTVEKIVNHTDSIIIHDVDTVWLTVHDTTVITEYVQRVIYESYFYLFPGQSANHVPDELKPYYDSFIADANARNIPLTGGEVIIQWVKQSDLPGENWRSSSWEMAGFQWVIYIDETLPIEESKSCMYREMARWQLKKKYSQDVNKIMSNFFRTSPEPTTNEINQLFAQ